MHLRLDTTRDLHRLTEITTTYDYMCPKRKEYSEYNFFWWQLKLERHLYDKKPIFLVVDLDSEEDNRGAETPRGPASTITSYGIWERFGSNKAARERFAAKNSWLNTLDSKLSFVSY
jgi:hypothetical protein